MGQDKNTGNWIYSDYSNIKKIDNDDKKLQLFIHKKMNIDSFHYLSVIKMNSTYLEITNRNYFFFGLLGTLFFIISSGCFLFVISLFAKFFIFKSDSNNLDIVFFGIVFVAIFLFFLNYKIAYKVFKKFEINSYYYLPIRLNRKNRKIYVYTQNEGIKIFKWDELFFYIAPVDWLYGIKKIEVRAAKLNDQDNIEFSFSLNSPTTFYEDPRQCLSYWEFLRQYMQDGPKKFYIDKNSLDKFDESKLAFCNDIDQKLESDEIGKLRLLYNYKPLGIMEMIFVAPIYYPWTWVRRYLIKHHAKIPLWPEDIDEECKIEDCDPYVVDASINKYFEIKLFPSRMAVKKEYLK